jgi:apoptosis-inducing factor 2
MSERNIVILGASFAGVGTTHYVLRHVLPKLPESNDFTYQVYLISPSSQFFHRIAGPRIVISKDAPGVPDQKVFKSVHDAFKQYNTKNLHFIEAVATAVDVSNRTITYKLTQGGNSATLDFHALVIATGFKTPYAAWSNQNDTSAIKSALSDIRSKLPNAKSVVIAGGGPAGVETAAEIGEYLNGSPGWFSSAPSNPKAKVTIVTSSSRLLTVLRPALAKKAEQMLKRVGVEVIYDTKVVSYPVNQNGTTTVNLHDGNQLTADVFIPATGIIPNTDFLPTELLSATGKVENNEKTLRVDRAGPRIYAIGDVGTYTRGGILSVYDAVPVVGTNLGRDLLAYHHSNGKEEKPKGPDREFTENKTETQIVPVGRSGGVGAAMGWKLPSFMVWLMKGRDYFLWSAPQIAEGTKWKSEGKWPGQNTGV